MQYFLLGSSQRNIQWQHIFLNTQADLKKGSDQTHEFQIWLEEACPWTFYLLVGKIAPALQLLGEGAKFKNPNIYIVLGGIFSVP